MILSLMPHYSKYPRFNGKSLIPRIRELSNRMTKTINRCKRGDDTDVRII